MFSRCSSRIQLSLNHARLGYQLLYDSYQRALQVSGGGISQSTLLQYVFLPDSRNTRLSEGQKMDKEGNASCFYPSSSFGN